MHLERFGLDSEERILIVHVDDIGMCQSTLSAFDQLWKEGAVSSGSVMAPCPWFPAVTEWYKRHPDADLGLHLTLTSESQNYRWGPLNRTSIADSLLDQSGCYFHKDRKAVCDHANVDAVTSEIQTQLDCVTQAGLKVTHLDNHMYTCLQPRFLPQFLWLAITHKLPALVTWEHLHHLGPAQKLNWINQLNNTGLPIFDRILVIKRCREIKQYLSEFRNAISNLPSGLSCLLVHPAKDSEELRKILPDSQYRVTEYHALLEISPLQLAQEMGVKLINYKTFR